MDKINDNNATPAKRTGVKNDESLDTGRIRIRIGLILELQK